MRAKRGEVAASLGDRVLILIRPEDMALRSSKAPAADQDMLTGIVQEISYHGDTFRLEVAVGQDMLKIKVPRAEGAGMEPGRQVFLTWPAQAARLLPAAAPGNARASGVTP